MTKETSDLEWKQMVLRTVMRAAIPVGDFGSRMAIQYAKEMAEFMEEFGVEIRPLSGQTAEKIRLAIAYMDQNDPPLGQ